MLTWRNPSTIIGSRYSACDLQHSNHGRYAYNPLLSALTQDCIAKETGRHPRRRPVRHLALHGRSGGELHRRHGGDQAAGVREQTVTMETLLDALDRNWQGYENLRQQMIACAPKYANDQAVRR